MDVDPRLTRLRALVDRLERLPVSEHRDWMLVEARARLVDVETGDAPRAMRPLEEEPPPPRAANGRAVKRPSAGHGPAAAEGGRAQREIPPVETPRPPTEAAPPDAAAADLGTDGLLWLEDPSGDSSVEPGDGAVGAAPWRRGLRG